MATTLSEILRASRDLDQQKRSLAEQQLEQASQKDFGQFLRALVGELLDETKPEDIQQLAGLLLKLYLTGQSEYVQQIKTQKFLEIHPEVSNQIKEGVLQGLKSRFPGARKSASSAVAAIALICLQQGSGSAGWPNLIPTLRGNVMDQNTTLETKISSLEAIGYICEALSPECLESADSDHLLTAIINGMDKSAPAQMRVAATSALVNTLVFASSNMKRPVERTKIAEVISEACDFPEDVQVRRLGFECMTKIAEHYYEDIAEYMNHFYNLTLKAIQSDSEEVGIQAIEFWSTICDEEIWLHNQIEEELLQGKQVTTCSDYILAALPTLVPLIQTSCLLKQDEDPSSGEWNLAIAGGTCLGLISQCVQNQILNVALPFVQANIQDKDWRKREAALVSFGSVLEGPSSDALRKWVEQGIGLFLQMLSKSSEPHEHVRDTAAWAVGVICDLHSDLVMEHLERILVAVISGLSDVPSVAAKNAFAIQNIARSFLESEDLQTNGLSRYVQVLFQKLLECASRQDASEQGLRNDCFEAVCSIVEASAQDCRPMVVELLKYVCVKLQAEATTARTADSDNALVSYSQTLLAISQKLGDDVAIYADDIIMLGMTVIKARNPIAQADAIIVIGSVCESIGENCLKHMDNFYPLLLVCLAQTDHYQVCRSASMVVGDISRALEGKVFPYCAKFVELLLSNLQNQTLHRVVKPPTISVLGDIALAIGPKFEPFLPSVMQTLQGAAEYSINAGDEEDEDLIEFVNQLREALLEAYTGIIQGLHELPGLEQYVPGMLPLVNRIIQDIFAQKTHVDDGVIKGAIGVLGDLMTMPNPQVKQFIASNQGYRAFLESYAHGAGGVPNPKIMTTAAWALSLCN